MKAHLKLVVLVLIFVSGTHSLLSSAPASNFTISGLNVSQPHTVVDSTGTKLIFWAMYPPQLQIHTTNGSLLCALNSTNFIKKVIWPVNYGPLVTYTIGSIVNILDQNTCQVTKSYNLAQIINVPLQGYQLESLAWIQQKPILTVAGRFAIYQIDLNQQKLINTFKVNDQVIKDEIQTICYSGDFSYLYVLTVGQSDDYEKVKIFDAKKQNQKELREVNMPDQTQIASIAPAKDNLSIIIYGLSVADVSVVILTIDNFGNLLTRITRLIWRPVVLITGTNLFDTAAIFNPEFLNIELARINDGKSLQSIPFPDLAAIKSGAYNNNTMVLLLNTSQVVTYSYLPDQLDPNPDDEGSSPVVWIIVGVVLGVIVIGAAAFFIIKKKKLFKKQDENYGKIQDEV